MLGDRLAFLVEWLDPASGITWKYQLLQYPDSCEIEMIDLKNKKTFLKRVRCEEITPDMLFIGAIVTVYSRQLKVVDYADQFTHRQLGSRQERTFAMVKPDAVGNMGQVVQAVEAAGFTISQMRLCKLSKAEVEQFYAVHCGKPFYERLTEFMSSGHVLAMELVAEGAIKKWRALIGPTDSIKARGEAPQSLRARFGTDGTRNACHGSDAPDTAAGELSFFFARSTLGRCVQGQNTSLCIIKPHIVRQGQAGAVLAALQQHFLVTALQQFHIDAINAAEFFEVYKGVVPPGEFSSMVAELTSGPFIAIEVADRQGANPVEALRECAGPADPEVAKLLRPNSLRSHFGISKVQNGVHCTDLAEDAPLEVSYFFEIMQQ
eukprot:jgi/Astpho2/4550/fgenesh1_pm.00067_%23_29_t